MRYMICYGIKEVFRHPLKYILLISCIMLGLLISIIFIGQINGLVVEFPRYENSMDMDYVIRCSINSHDTNLIKDIPMNQIQNQITSIEEVGFLERDMDSFAMLIWVSKVINQ